MLLNNMILLTQGQTSETFITTLYENVTIVNPVFLFEFKNVTTKSIVKFFKSYSVDESIARQRYNEFRINTALLFGNEAGQWQYKVYQTNNEISQDTTGLILLENGKMTLKAAVINIKGYNPTTTYKGYAG